MNPFSEFSVTESEIQRVHDDYLAGWTRGDALMRQFFPADTAKLASARIMETLRAQVARDTIYKNDVYQVNTCTREFPDFGPLIHLSIKRIDRKPIHDWRDLQEIKNLIVGPEHEALELYPAESRRVDTANQYHLWVVPDPNYRVPFGFFDGRFCDDSSLGGAVNRPFNDTQK